MPGIKIIDTSFLPALIRGKTLLSKSYRFALALLLGGLLSIQACTRETATQATAKEAAPDFTIELFGGGNFRLSDYKGKAVVINFFASWCVSCGEETPIIEKVAHQYPPQEVAFLAIAVDDTEKKAKEFLRKTGLTIPAGLDKTGKIKDGYGLYGMPTTYFIDREGKINYLHAGVVTEDLLKHEIGKLLAAQTTH
ncbi:MAG: TlpA family protein disulfide reductase [Nitrosomonadales bacterium]|nr:TlpA family protein disulfide reductase [Nitrosomonadales bacterium]